MFVQIAERDFIHSRHLHCVSRPSAGLGVVHKNKNTKTHTEISIISFLILQQHKKISITYKIKAFQSQLRKARHVRKSSIAYVADSTK